MNEIDALHEIGVEIIALDATDQSRPDHKSLESFYNEIRKKYPDQRLMADCSTFEEAVRADRLGFDFIGTTLVGYTPQSKGNHIEQNDFELIRRILSTIKNPLIAEGNIDTPQKARRVIELGSIQRRSRIYYYAASDYYKKICKLYSSGGNRMKEFLHNTWKHRAHVIMSLPAVLILFFFSYVPMAGLVLAFKKF